MTRRRAGVLLILIAVVTAGTAFADSTVAPRPSARCKKVFAKPFTVELDGVRFQLRVVPYGVTGTPAQIFEGAQPRCRKLGTNWRVAVGSFGKSFLERLASANSKPLATALAACPVTYRNVDTVCPPCPPDSQHCPCAERDIADWLFCQRDLPAPSRP